MICIAMSLCADVFVHSQPLLSLKHKQKHIMKWQSGCAAMQTHHPPMKEDRKYHLLSDLKEISDLKGKRCQDIPYDNGPLLSEDSIFSGERVPSDPVLEWHLVSKKG